MNNFHSTLNRTNVFNGGLMNMGYFYDLQCFKKYETSSVKDKLSKDSLKIYTYGFHWKNNRMRDYNGMKESK